MKMHPVPNPAVKFAALGRKVICPKCGNSQITEKIGTIKTIIYVLLLPFLLVGALLLPMPLQIGLGSWLGKKTICTKCGEVFETK